MASVGVNATVGMNLMNKPNKKAAVLYHYPCPDGACAALAAHLFFSASSLPAFFFPNTVYKPLRPEQLPLDDISDVYLLDFVGPAGFLEDISRRVGRVVVLDHHKTAVDALGHSSWHNVTKVIDMEKSGATISFDYFKHKLWPGAPALDTFVRVRPIFDYIEDVDLWRWRLPNSKAFDSGLKDLNIEYSVHLNPSLFDQLLSLDLDTIVKQGMVSLSRKQELIQDTLSHAYEIALGAGKFGHCLAVDADSVSELRSELGHQLAMKSCNQKLRGIGAVVYRVPELENDVVKVSIRSVDDEDTTPISQEYGGGGHRNASSFLLSRAEFRKWKMG